MKVATIVGTRPEIIRLSRVIVALDENFDHVLIHTGQNYDHELNQIFFDDLGLRLPDRYLNAAKENANQTIAAVISAVDDVLRDVKPDAVLVLGDTNSCVGLLAAKKLGIPTFHMEAGNRCFDLRVPEETNRRLVDHIADINLPYSQIARQYLLREGLPPEQVIVTGSPMHEVLSHYRSSIDASTVLSDLGLSDGNYFVVSLHREENVDTTDRFRGFADMLNRLAERHELPIIVSTHPRTRNQIEKLGITFGPEIRLLKPLSFTAYVKLQQHSRAVLSDSGTISEESAILGFNALNLRESHERPEAMEEGVVMMVGNNTDRVFNALEILQRQGKSESTRPRLPVDYLPTNVSAKVARIILSYTDYVNRNVLRK
jgi:UDP-N-acetylglucosamine 2-epimerase (non-hydrolysing)